MVPVRCKKVAWVRVKHRKATRMALQLKTEIPRPRSLIARQPTRSRALLTAQGPLFHLWSTSDDKSGGVSA
jgi:hypothetical protein